MTSKRLTHKAFYALAQQCIAFARSAPAELTIAAIGAPAIDAELCNTATEFFARGPRPKADMSKEEDVKAPRKNSSEWVLWMIEGGAVLKKHRPTPVSAWKHELLVANRDITEATPVSEAKVQSLVDSGKLVARLIETKPGCWDSVVYEPKRKAA